MASEIDIANLALARLGDEATVSSLSPPEGSAQAEHAARFYPIARDALLELHDWHFATRRAAPAALVGTWAPWSYAYAPPADCLALRAVLAAGGADHDVQPFERELGPSGESVILTNAATPILRYIARVADPTRFSPLFVDVLSILLASYLAGPILKGDVGRNEARALYQVAIAMLAQAKTSDANQRRGDGAHTVDWIAGR